MAGTKKSFGKSMREWGQRAEESERSLERDRLSRDPARAIAEQKLFDAVRRVKKEGISG